MASETEIRSSPFSVRIPKLSLVVLIGASGSGKSTFASRHFLPTEVLSSDWCRGLVSDDPSNQSATGDAFDVLNYVAAKRLSRGLLTVVDATNVQAEARQPLVALARRYHCLPVAIVLDVPENVCHERNRNRADRKFGPHVIGQQKAQLRRSLRRLGREGFRHVSILDSPEKIELAVVERIPLWNDKRDEHGPLDIIGDVHGCADELEKLLAVLGYQRVAVEGSQNCWASHTWRHPANRRAVFVGDLVDRGPRVLDALQIVHDMVETSAAYCVPGNHDVKLMRSLQGRDVQVRHGLAQSLAEFASLPDSERKDFSRRVARFLDELVSHYVFDDGKLVVAHAGLPEEMHGRGSGKVREFALYGETTGETDEFGFPVRHNWAGEYRGEALVVYGHTPVVEPDWLNRTVNIDTGCVFGGSLTALRYPENETVSVRALRTWFEPVRPLRVPDAAANQTTQQLHDDVLDAQDVLGKRIVSTGLNRTITIREENATAAMEVMSRFAANPKWLIYLPPTMSPGETSNLTGFLEHPREVFDYFRRQQVGEVVCQEKHMGSRAVVVVCRDVAAAERRFGIREDEQGIVHTRTGRRFFNDSNVERELLVRVASACDSSGFWDEFNTDWACLDCELMPWSAKAQELLRSQYAAVSAAGKAALPSVVAALESTMSRVACTELDRAMELRNRFDRQQQAVELFTTAYRKYCWRVDSIDDLKLAPFHLLATEGRVHTDQNHVWHMNQLAKVCSAGSGILLPTDFRVIDVNDEQSVDSGIQWWNALTDAGGEGMVVKPLNWIVRSTKGLVQTAIKCRGREYLRIIYSPDYDSDDNLVRLRRRSLGRKRSLALREFALGIEGLERFVKREPLRRVHQCVFGVLALESEPVDPRL